MEQTKFWNYKYFYNLNWLNSLIKESDEEKYNVITKRGKGEEIREPNNTLEWKLISAALLFSCFYSWGLFLHKKNANWRYYSKPTGRMVRPELFQLNSEITEFEAIICKFGTIESTFSTFCFIKLFN